MPSNQDFKLEILIADTPVPEYEKNNEYFVECNLSTPVSYMHQQADFVNGETEIQSWPVTPYKIMIKAAPVSDSEYPKYFRVLVDGVKVKGVSLDPGEQKIIKGFRDGPAIREFLFSMPRYAKDMDDRIEAHRQRAVGKIVVECWAASLRRSKWTLRSKNLEFKQANKKDSTVVTEGKYTMATSCPGKVVSGRAIHRLVDSWKLKELRSSITVSYHMAHTLSDMGLSLQPLNIPLEKLQEVNKYKRSTNRVDNNSHEQTLNSVKMEPTTPIEERESFTKTKQSQITVIDLTEDTDMAMDIQDTAMDLSKKSTQVESSLPACTSEVKEDGISVNDDHVSSSNENEIIVREENCESQMGDCHELNASANEKDISTNDASEVARVDKGVCEEVELVEALNINVANDGGALELQSVQENADKISHSTLRSENGAHNELSAEIDSENITRESEKTQQEKRKYDSETDKVNTVRTNEPSILDDCNNQEPQSVKECSLLQTVTCEDKGNNNSELCSTRSGELVPVDEAQVDKPVLDKELESDTEKNSRSVEKESENVNSENKTPCE